MDVPDVQASVSLFVTDRTLFIHLSTRVWEGSGMVCVEWVWEGSGMVCVERVWECNGVSWEGVSEE